MLPNGGDMERSLYDCSKNFVDILKKTLCVVYYISYTVDWMIEELYF